MASDYTHTSMCSFEAPNTVQTPLSRGPTHLGGDGDLGIGISLGVRVAAPVVGQLKDGLSTLVALVTCALGRWGFQ